VHGRRAIYPNSPVSYQKPEKWELRTTNDELHVVHKTMHNLKRLSSSHASLIESEAVESMEHIFDLALSQEFLCKNF
jgi:hypothetical protein